MLQVIISPAKQMEVRADAFAPRGIPPFPARTRRLVQALRDIEREQGAVGLKALWLVNDRLLAQNIERLRGFVPVMDETELDDPAVARLSAPAVFSYVGIQYRSMAPDVLDLRALDWLQGHLWVLSALYGCARPFDAVEPYRLEMGAGLAVDGARDLYGFWGADIAREIEAAVRAGEGEPAIVNLASVEYAKAVLPYASAETRIVTCVFGEELRDGRPVQRATASKIARGSMVRWMAERSVGDIAELERFDVGYAFAPELSGERASGPSTRRGKTAGQRILVFMRR